MPEGLEPGQQIVLRAGDTIKFRGDNPKGFSYYNEDEDDYSYYSLFFGSDTDNPCGIISGNIMSLLSKDNFQSLTEIPCDGCFYSLFEWSEISDASNLVLPATELAD
ncbi:MAG: hypothetical protein MJ219_00625 [Mycoplasmoidaceae bacterium]|nr:hypothetical protein [Mycoplasmoidaceae bacterium]